MAQPRDDRENQERNRFNEENKRKAEHGTDKKRMNSPGYEDDEFKDDEFNFDIEER